MQSIGMLAVGVAAMVYRGLIILCFWSWFITPLGVPEIGVAQAMGLALLVAALDNQRLRKQEVEDDYSWGAQMFAHFFALGVLHLLGFIVSLWV
jgi:hypothetical protein